MTGHEELARMIAEASRVVFFSGAGISTASGIPDFRSPETGLWNRPGAMEMFSTDGFQNDPDGFYRLAAPLFRTVSLARPNIAHKVIAELERGGKVRSVITQNIDGLHQKAGSMTVHELHGGASGSICTGCGEMFDTESIFRDAVDTGHAPRCGGCGGIIKPDVVFFGEMLPMDALERAEADSRDADLFVVVGSSLTVMPAALMPGYAVEAGAELAIVNSMETPYDGLCDLRLTGDIGEIFAGIAVELDISVEDDGRKEGQ